MPINYEAAKTLIKGLVQKMKSFRGNWEQNDPTADDYIKNRPFYTEKKETVIIPKMTVSISDNETIVKYSPIIPFEIGQTYSVLWNGDSYSCIANELDGFPTLGDFEFSNLPFCIVVSNDMFKGAYIASPTNGNYTVSVTSLVSEVHKIDNKYLPDMNYLSYKKRQNLTYEQQETALWNMGDAFYDGVAHIANEQPFVTYEGDQWLSDSQKEFARNNIEAISENDVYSDGKTYEYNWDGSTDSGTLYHLLLKDGLYYKIADLPCTTNYGILDCNVTMSDGTTYTNWMAGSTNCYVLGGDSMCAIVVKNPGEVITHSIGNTMYSCTAESSGIYGYSRNSLHVSELSITFKIPKSGIRVNDANGTENTITVEADGCISDSCIPETIARKTDILSPDWNQNDPEAADYVKNRPFYTGDPVETTLIPEQTVAFTNQGDMCNAISPVNVDLVEGNTYTVIFDGETYECTCQLLGDAYLFIGSPKVFGEEDTGEPFIYASVNGVAYEWFAYDTETEHTLSLSTIEGEIIKLPSKYIDWDSSPFKRPILTMPVSDNIDEDLTDEQKQEYYDAWRSGSLIVYNNGLIIGMFYSRTVGFQFVYIDSAGTFHSYGSGKWSHFGLSQDSLEYLINSQRAITLHSGVDEHSEYNTATLLWINGRPAIYKTSLEPDGTTRIYNDHYLVQHGDKEIVLTSSTEGSTKKFKITVDDSGNLTATEVV